MADRFELEDAIVAMRDICDNIELLQLDGPQDKILADIIACGIVHKLKYDRLWQVFLDVFDLQDGKASYTSGVDSRLDDNVDLDTDSLPPESLPNIPHPHLGGCCGYRRDYKTNDPCEGLDGIW